jgi:hypothetical protein
MQYLGPLTVSAGLVDHLAPVLSMQLHLEALWSFISVRTSVDLLATLTFLTCLAVGHLGRLCLCCSYRLISSRRI